MKRNVLFNVPVVALFTMTAFACKKDSDNNGPGTSPAGSKVVKYEVSGAYTGRFRVLYLTPLGNQTLEVSLPWTQEVTFTSLPAGAGLGASAVTGFPGVADQLATAKIYVNGQVVQSSSDKAGANGYIYGLPTLAYTLQ